MSFDMIVSGIGGQGVVLVCNIIGEACAISGQKAISGEMHGLSQRSGSVFIHQRIGDDVMSPLVPYGDANVVLALEISEALRYLFYLKEGGTVITNNRFVHTPGESQDLVSKKSDSYLTYDEVLENIKKSGADLHLIEGLDLAKQAGNALAENVTMLGAMAALPDFPVAKEHLIEAVKNTVPKKAIDVNVKAFELGYAAFKS